LFAQCFFLRGFSGKDSLGGVIPLKLSRDFCWVVLAVLLGRGFVWGGEGAAALSEAAGKGKELAAAVCQSCHLLPGPELLDRATWETKALPAMAAWLGVATVNLGTNAEGKRIREAGIYPASPLVTEEQWRALQAYFREASPAAPLAPTNKPVARRNTNLFRAKALQTTKDIPYTTLVKIDEAQRAIYVGDAQEHSLKLIGAAGETRREFSFPSGPVGVQAWGTNLCVTLVGRIFPSDQWGGQVWMLTNGAGGWNGGAVLRELPRLAHTTIANLSGKPGGLPELVLAGFGNRLGKLMLWKEKGGGQFSEEVLSALPGAIATHAEDIDGDGRMDLLLLRGQAREGVFALYNRGDHFEERPVIEYPPSYGTAGWWVGDFDKDGKTDLLIACGDVGDYTAPVRAYNGVRLYLGLGKGAFREAWSYPMSGAFQVEAADFDGDGDLDIMASSYFPDFVKYPTESILFFRNDGNFQFAAQTFEFGNDGRWIVMDAGDVDGDGDVDVVLGSFPKGPQSVPIPDAVGVRWFQKRASVLFLENLTKQAEPSEALKGKGK
jgi:hypothetical protein